MAKKPIQYGRLFLTGLVWIPVYLEIISLVIYYADIPFKPLSYADWHNRITGFVNNEWIIDTGTDWATLMMMLLFFPLMLIGWRFVYKIKWNRLVPRCFKEKKVKKQSLQVASVKKTFEPAKLRIQSSAVLSVPIGNAAPQAGVQMSQMPTIEDLPPAYQQPLPQQKKYEDEDEVQQMLGLTANIKADFFPHVNMDGAYASFALSTENKAAIVQIINRPDSVWAVDTGVDVAESCWFDQTSCLDTPLKGVLGIAQQLQASEPESTALSVILLMSGQLLNVDETLNYYENNNVMLLRLETAEVDEIPLFMDFVQEYFGLKTDESEES